MRSKILILQHLPMGIGLLSSCLDHSGFVASIVDATKPVPHNVSGYAAIISLGGFQHAYDDFPYLAQEKLLLLQAVRQGTPVLGICLGGQILASALGAEVRRADRVEIGLLPIQLTDEGRVDPLFQGIAQEQELTMMQWHEDVFSLPRNAVLLASNGYNQAFRYGPSAYGLQFHPEIDPALLQEWVAYGFLQTLAATYKHNEVHSALSTLSSHSCHYRAIATQMIENFFRLSSIAQQAPLLASS